MSLSAEGMYRSDGAMRSDAAPRSTSCASPLLAATSDWLLELDRNGICIDSAGPCDSALFEARDFLGKSLNEAFPQDVAHRMLSALERAREQSAVERLECALSMADGLHSFEMRIVSTAHGAAVSLRDVTERNSAAWRLAQSQSQLDALIDARTLELEQAQRELEAFTRCVGHDLRAPLRAILGFGEIIHDRKTAGFDTENARYFENMRVAASQLERLIDDLMRLAQVSRRELEMRDVDVSALAHDGVKRLRTEQRERAVHVSIQPKMHMRGDPLLLRTLLDNLIENAWKFTVKNPAATIEIGSSDIDGKRTFYVRDNGVGFDMQYAARLFEPFKRLHPREEFEGNGVGLAISARIVERHQGRIWAQAEVGKGTTMYVQLPR